MLPAPRPNGTLRALGPRADRSRRLKYNSLSLTPASPSRGERPSWTQRPVSIPAPSRLLRPSSSFIKRTGLVESASTATLTLNSSARLSRPASGVFDGTTSVSTPIAFANSSTLRRDAGAASSLSTRYVSIRTGPIRPRIAAISSAVRLGSSIFGSCRLTLWVLEPSTKSTTAASALTMASRKVRPPPGMASFHFVRRSSPTSVRVRHVTRSSASGARSNAGFSVVVCAVGAGACACSAAVRRAAAMSIIIRWSFADPLLTPVFQTGETEKQETTG